MEVLPGDLSLGDESQVRRNASWFRQIQKTDLCKKNMELMGLTTQNGGERENLLSPSYPSKSQPPSFACGRSQGRLHQGESKTPSVDNLEDFLTAGHLR